MFFLGIYISECYLSKLMKFITTAFIFHENKLLFVLHKKNNLWMHVGGHVEEGESFEDALHREIREEVNLTVQLIDVFDLHMDTTDVVKPQCNPFFIHDGVNPEGKRYVALDYVCKATTSDVTLQESELLDYRWVEEKDIQNLKTYLYLKKLALKAFAFYKEKSD